MALDDLLHAWDVAHDQGASMGFMWLSGVYCGVSADAVIGSVNVWLVEDVSTETAFDIEDYDDPHEFTEAVHERVREMRDTHEVASP